MNLLLKYLLVINIITFLIFYIDKKKAIKGQRRIPESRLLFLSFMGGSLGGILAMALIKHKINKVKFIIGMPLILILNFFIFFEIFRRFIM